MPIINTGRQGKIDGKSSSNFTTARSTGNAAFDSYTSNNSAAFMYLFSSGRGGGTHLITRTYFYFDVSSMSGGTAVDLIIEGNTSTGTQSRWIVVKSSAFGGNGATALSVNDFVPTFATPYSNFASGWNTTSTNTITLNATALSDINTNNHFTLALVEYTYDYQNIAATSNIQNAYGIKFATSPTAYLDVTGGGTDVDSIDSISSGNIDEWNGYSWSAVSEIDGIIAN